MFSLPVVLVAVILGVVVFYLYQMFYWKRRGIAGPPGSLFLGQYWQMMDPNYPVSLLLRDWTKKYGKVYGIQEGIRKVLVVSDPDMLRELFVDKFDYFYGRKSVLPSGDLQNDARVHLFESEGNRWKRIRTICAPSFSSGSLKKITDTVEDSAIEVVRLLEDISESEPVNIYKYYQEYTMDVILRIAMGQNGSNLFNNSLTPHVQKIFQRDLRKPIFLMAAIMPFFRVQFRRMYMSIAKIRKSPAMPIFGLCYKTVDERIAQREKDLADGIEPGEPADFVDLFLDARAEEMVNNDTEFSKNSVTVSRKLTREEIVAQCFVFLIAGFDTTSNALAYTSWLLATNPDKQKKVQEEIDEHCSTEIVGFDTLSKLKYMECVIKESLRMFPLASIAASRRCMKETTLGDIPIEKETFIWADVWTLHYDKKLWGPDADEFVPERWQRDEVRHSMAWLPFGAGPRVCIGQRLAYIEEKLALLHILRKYTMEQGPKTEPKLNLQGSTTTQPEAVTIYLKRR